MRLRSASLGRPARLFVFVIAFAISSVDADACTRAVYLGRDGMVMTARPMDWRRDISNNLWIFPRGMERTGEAGRVRRLDLGEHQVHTFSGDATADFREAPPFRFLGLP